MYNIKTIALVSFLILISCKKKDECDNSYMDCTNQELGKDLAIFCISTSQNEIEIINASCKTLSTNEYVLSINGNTDEYWLPSRRMSIGGHITYKDLPFKLNADGDIIYLKHKGETISIFHTK